jgi:hypothetical protein
MDAASLRTTSAARAGFADAPAASIAKITAGRYLVDLGFMGTRQLGGSLSQDSMGEAEIVLAAARALHRTFAEG